jgi:hypothetical protein
VGDFSRAFSAALIQYTLGRPLSFRDEPLIDHMVSEAERQDFALRSFIFTLVHSAEFRSK